MTGGAVPCVQGHAHGFACQNVDLVAFLPPAALGDPTPLGMGEHPLYFNTVWGWTDSAAGREFVLLGRVDGVAFVEITDPIHPVYLGYLPRHAGSEPVPWRDVKVYQHHAFIVADISMTHGLQVFDLTQLRTVTHPPVVFQETAHADDFGSAHTLALDEATGYAYAAGGLLSLSGCGSGLNILDVRTPTAPTLAGCYTEPRLGGNNGPGYIHEAQCVVYHGPDQQYAGREICLAAAEQVLGIVDVTDKSAPKTLSVVGYPNVGYAHQGWLSEDQRYFFMDDELDAGVGNGHTRTIVLDLLHLEDPVVATEFFGRTTATDHNLYVRGRYVYQANYTAGLQVLDVADPVHPREVGYFDTYPAGDEPGFLGAWSNFPFFTRGGEGLVAVSGMGEGLFLVRFRPPTP